jgi:hypothetical protein
LSAADPVLFGVFLVVIAVLVVVLWRAGTQRAKPGQVEMVLVGAAAGSAEAHLWATALKTAGIASRVINVSDFTQTEGGTSPYAYEVWVRARDEDRARKVLGL